MGGLDGRTSSERNRQGDGIMRRERPSSGFGRGRICEVMVTAVAIWFRAVSGIEAGRQAPSAACQAVTRRRSRLRQIGCRRLGRWWDRKTRRDRAEAGERSSARVTPVRRRATVPSVLTKHGVIRTGYARGLTGQGDRAACVPRIAHADHARGAQPKSRRHDERRFGEALEVWESTTNTRTVGIIRSARQISLLSCIGRRCKREPWKILISKIRN